MSCSRTIGGRCGEPRWRVSDLGGTEVERAHAARLTSRVSLGGDEGMLLCRPGAAAFLDELPDSLAALAADTFVETPPAFALHPFASPASDRFIEVGAVALTRCLTALFPDPLVKLRAVATFRGLTAAATGFSHRHLFGRQFRHLSVSASRVTCACASPPTGKKRKPHAVATPQRALGRPHFVLRRDSSSCLRARLLSSIMRFTFCPPFLPISS